MKFEFLNLFFVHYFMLLLLVLWALFFLASFLIDPSSAINGFGLGFKLMLDSSVQKIKEPSYVLDAGGGVGKGVSVFIKSGKIFCIVAVEQKMWQVRPQYGSNWCISALISFARNVFTSF